MITIQQAKEDSYGNAKENIFLAFDEKGQYFGSGYVYPTVNRHQTYETPYLIYIAINVEEQPQEEEIKQLLFESIMERAKTLQKENKELNCRIYAGFASDQSMMDFYIRNGFEEDYSIYMEVDIAQKAEDFSQQNIKVEEFSITEKEQFEEFKKLYDEIFVTPLDEEFAKAQKEDVSFRNFKFYINEEFVGGFSLRVEDKCGWIESLYLLEVHRGKGLSKIMMNYIHDYFREKGLSKSKLEVWELDRRAVNLYKTFGYQEIQRNCMFPGITVYSDSNKCD